MHWVPRDDNTVSQSFYSVSQLNSKIDFFLLLANAQRMLLVRHARHSRVYIRVYCYCIVALLVYASMHCVKFASQHRQEINVL